MLNRRETLLLGICLAINTLMPVIPAAAQEAGRIEGRLFNDVAALRAVTVTLQPARGPAQTTISQDDGSFRFDGVAPGRYSIDFVLGEHIAHADNVDVRPGETARIEQQLDWESGFAETVTVFAASRRLERIVEAPSAITHVALQDIQLAAPSAQLPKLLEFTPGVQVSQSGLFDFNLNVRGFNNQLNRRIQTLIDGRDPSIPITSGQEWASMALMLDDIVGVELLRGPSAALYGPNSFNGVLNIQTSVPRDVAGGKLRFTTGELGTAIVTGRWAAPVAEGWYLKVRGGHFHSKDFSQSRNQSGEYAGLPLEALPLARSRDEISSGSIRVDKYFAGGQVATFEGGADSLRGPVFLTVTGRLQPDVTRTWTRATVNSPHWNALFYSNTRNSDDTSPSTGARLAFDDVSVHTEIQGNRQFQQGRARLVGGAAYGRTSSDTADASGRQTFLKEPVSSNLGSLFGQLDYQVTKRLKAVAATRWDENTFHDAQFSPKAAVVIDLAPQHSVRIGYNRAFQVANAGELFVAVPGGPPIDLSAVEASFGPVLGGTRLGLNVVPIDVFGNDKLAVESIKAFEAGYRGVIGARAFVTVDFYSNRMKDFISPLLPGVNPKYGPYRAPAALAQPARSLVEGALNSAIPGLSNDASGAPIIVYSLANAGKVDSRGLELGTTIQVQRHVAVDASYAWFDFDVVEKSFGADLSPNAPAHQAAAGVTFARDTVSASIRGRWVDTFHWSAGTFVGDVPAYAVFDLEGNHKLTRNWELGVNVSNLLDKRHYEVFGGDVLRRRALVSLGYSWN
jgi:iron complex outermembrane receptor protein